VEGKVAAPYRAVAKLSRSQLKHLLNANCGGTARVQHVWQAIDPVSSAAAVKATDELTTETLQGILGVLDTLSPWVLSSCFLPQRYGGLGYRRSEDIKFAAFIGGFVMAAYGLYGTASYYPPLVTGVNCPEMSQLPSMKVFCEA